MHSLKFFKMEINLNKKKYSEALSGGVLASVLK